MTTICSLYIVRLLGERYQVRCEREPVAFNLGLDDDYSLTGTASENENEIWLPMK